MSAVCCRESLPPREEESVRSGTLLPCKGGYWWGSLFLLLRQHPSFWQMSPDLLV